MPNKISPTEELKYLKNLDDQLKAHFPADRHPRVKRGWRGLEAVIDAPTPPLSRGGVAPKSASQLLSVPYSTHGPFIEDES